MVRVLRSMGFGVLEPWRTLFSACHRQGFGVAVHGMIAVMNPELQANQFEGGKAYLDPTKPTIFGFPVFRVSVAVKAC